MPRIAQLTDKESAFIRLARVAHLATADSTGHPLVIPICYVFDGDFLYSPIDEKPKQSAPQRLKRLRNIEQNPHVALVIDRYDENWQHLAYLLIRGTAKVLQRGSRHQSAVQLLRDKYPQYRSMAIDARPMIVITPRQFKSWGAL